MPAPVDEHAYLRRGWLSCISEWKAVGDSGAWLGDYSHAKGGGARKVKDRRTGQVETELVPGEVWLALKSLYCDSLFVPPVVARVSRALTLKQGRKMSDPASRADIPHFIKMYGLDMSIVKKRLD